MAQSNHRTTLPQSALAGCQLPQRGSREGLSPFIRVLAKIVGFGRFSSPLRKLRNFYIPTIHRRTLPQLRCAQQLPQRGSRGTFPFNRVLAKIRGYGRFSSPLRNSKFFTLYHSSYRPETATLRAIFIAPTGGQRI